MKKLEGEVKEILDLAGAVIADKGFQGSGYVTPAKKPQDRELYMREHEYNNQVSSIRAPIERAVAHLKTWKVLFTDYRRHLTRFLIPSAQPSAYISNRGQAPRRTPRACTIQDQLVLVERLRSTLLSRETPNRPAGLRNTGAVYHQSVQKLLP